eukprot:CAMPEP_0201579836 /NCGR_PEP_ID=MMETSP0190_2-20130828/27714_1 /ASSEMBLY_ACC=CAM_ASM_000263 /TAXON_ID=37353 /ORGANISM="Rosalina sp." /LENGTH=180 /DNA_ID=CAMNT_0048014849 /DNA_START=419 /DNA_END=958 /DNA_ORIENTATION=+
MAPGMDVIQEGYYDEEAQYTNMYDENGNYIQSNFSDNEHDEDDDDMESKENDDDNVSTTTNATNTSYYSPARAWYGLTSIPSMVFGGYNQESDRSQDDESDSSQTQQHQQQNDETGIAGIDNGVDHNNHQSLIDIENVNMNANANVNANGDNMDKDIDDSESKQNYEPLPDHSSHGLNGN